MKRGRFALITATLLLALGASAAAVVWALVQTPDFYQQTLREEVRVDPVVRKQEARQLEIRTQQLVEEIKQAETWSQEFTQSQINNWLAMELDRTYGHLIPAGVDDPRVQFVDGSVQIGFRLEHNDWQGIVSLQLKPSVPAGNRLAIEVESIRAGLVPVPVEQILRRVAERIEEHGWEVEWTEQDGHPVAGVQLPVQEANPVVLEAVEVEEGLLRISGRRELTNPSDPRMFRTTRVADQSGVR